ncbi:MAG: hypothetical protein KME17_13015 [Cyanosarcina radialis HA8281-LM2]|jgi:hypothetical protein|nr:hypothetical protein [Cyanosarcina radialis HA8281-LM2]
MGRWGDGAMGRWGDGAMGRWGRINVSLVLHMGYNIFCNKSLQNSQQAIDRQEIAWI